MQPPFGCQILADEYRQAQGGTCELKSKKNINVGHLGALWGGELFHGLRQKTQMKTELRAE